MCQKWDIKCFDETMKGWCMVVCPMRNEIPILLQFSAWELSSRLTLLFHCPIFSFRAPPSLNLTHLLPFLWLPVVFLVLFTFCSFFFFCLSPFYRIFYDFPAPFSVSRFLNQYIHHRLFLHLSVSFPVWKKGLESILSPLLLLSVSRASSCDGA